MARSSRELQVHAAPQRKFKCCIFRNEGPGRADLVNHQLRVTQRQIGEALFGTFINHMKTDQVTIESAAFLPVADG
jgi:hypothetical protein